MVLLEAAVEASADELNGNFIVSFALNCGICNNF